MFHQKTRYFALIKVIIMLYCAFVISKLDYLDSTLLNSIKLIEKVENISRL